MTVPSSSTTFIPPMRTNGLSFAKVIPFSRAMLSNEWFLSWSFACFAASGDRKSTRLNSSHVSISYAVFCLKKQRLAQVTDRDDKAKRGDLRHLKLAHRAQDA